MTGHFMLTLYFIMMARVLLGEAIISFRAMGMTLSLGEAEALRAPLDG